MKTILITFTDLGKPVLKDFKENHCRKYSFRVKDSVNIKEGDVVRSPAYNSNMLVTDVLNKDYLYVNNVTGELKTELTSTFDYPIKTLKFTERRDLTEYACVIGTQEE